MMLAEYQKLGWRVIRIRPGTKAGRDKGWALGTSPPIPAGYTGPMGLAHAFSGTCAIDVDQFEEAAAWLLGLGVDLRALYQEGVSIHSGVHNHGKLIYRLPFPLTSATYFHNGHHAINFRCAARGGSSQQDVLPPSIHPDTQQPYRWQGDFRHLPVIPPALLSVWCGLLDGSIDNNSGRALISRERVLTRQHGVEDCREQALDALRYLDPDCDRNLWVRIGMAMQMCGCTYEDFDDWSSGGRKYAGSEDTLTRWNSFSTSRDDGVGPGTLFALAGENGFSTWEKPSIEDQFAGVESAPVPPLDTGTAPLSDREALAALIKGLTGSSPLDDVLTRVAHCRFSAVELEDVLQEIQARTGRSRGVLSRQVNAASKTLKWETRKRDALARHPFFDCGSGRGLMVEQIAARLRKGGPDGDQVLPTVDNVDTILREGFGTIYCDVQYNDLTRRPEFSHAVSGERIDLGEDPITPFHIHMAADFQLTPAPSWTDTKRIFNVAVRDRSYNPVEAYFKSGQWDGVPRVDSYMNRNYGVESNDYTLYANRYLFLSAVERAMTPGCQVDSIIVLEGPQGIGKSWAVRNLVPNREWFHELVMSGGKPDVEIYRELRTHWIVEYGELAGLSKRGIEEVKVFLTKQTDFIRTLYTDDTSGFARRCIIIGTTNESDYLSDTSGNRRFLPIVCTQIDFDNIPKETDQVWFESFARWEKGERSVDAYHAMRAQASEEQRARVKHDLIVDRVANALESEAFAGRTQIASIELADHINLMGSALRLPHVTYREIANALRLLDVPWESKGLIRFKEGPYNEKIRRGYVKK